MFSLVASSAGVSSRPYCGVTPSDGKKLPVTESDVTWIASLGSWRSDVPELSTERLESCVAPRARSR